MDKYANFRVDPTCPQCGSTLPIQADLQANQAWEATCGTCQWTGIAYAIFDLSRLVDVLYQRGKRL